MQSAKGSHPAIDEIGPTPNAIADFWRGSEDVMAIAGFVAPGFEPLLVAFQQNLLEGSDRGAAFSAVVNGRVVVDIWGGIADPATERPWRADTVAGIFSGSKGLVATCLLLLLERGQLDLEQPVCRYWPDFAARGKEAILVRHVVSHQAGLPGLLTPATPEEAADHVRMAALLAQQPAIHEPGAWIYYHAMTFGWLCGELVRRVDGRTVGRFFAEEIAGPLGLDAWIGLPIEQQSRVAVLIRGPGVGAQKPNEETTPAERQLAWSIWDNPPRFSADPLPANQKFWQAAEVPASNGIASARAMARLYGALASGGVIDGVRILSPEAIALGQSLLGRGRDPFLNQNLAFGVGFQLPCDGMPFGPVGLAFGHPGAGGSMHGAWPEFRAGFSYVTNTLRRADTTDPRADRLLRALYASLTIEAANDGR